MFQDMENDDFAGSFNDAPPEHPLEFPPCSIADCVRMTVRVFIPALNSSRTVQNVLVRLHTLAGGGIDGDGYDDDDDDEMSSGSSSSSSSSSSSVAAVADSSLEIERGGEENATVDVDTAGGRAYWLQRTLSHCIFGNVRMAYVLKSRPRPTMAEGVENEEAFAEWEVTTEKCAVKEMSWDSILQLRIAENPRSEINAMAYMANAIAPDDGHERDTDHLRQVMNSRHVLLPMDSPMSDGRFLYSIMPYCNGGELLGALDGMQRFTEPQARYWINQILTGIETLQFVGLCHRDISLENILVHDRTCVIMDYGMSFRIPYSNVPPTQGDFVPPELRGERKMMVPSGTMGKWNYMSPEIAADTEPFDGHAVDLFAVGAILFTMVTGDHGWETPTRTDESFRFLSGGYLERVLTEWNTGLTHSCMDLLQRMIFIHPTNRLSLQQIRAHPWMQEEMEPPAARPPWA